MLTNELHDSKQFSESPDMYQHHLEKENGQMYFDSIANAGAKSYALAKRLDDGTMIKTAHLKAFKDMRQDVTRTRQADGSITEATRDENSIDYDLIVGLCKGEEIVNHQTQFPTAPTFTDTGDHYTVRTKTIKRKFKLQYTKAKWDMGANGQDGLCMPIEI